MAGLADVGLPGAGLSDFEGRRSCSSAFRFVPATTVFFSEESRDAVLGLRTSDLAVEEDTGGAGEREVEGGIADGFPVSIDDSTESRNCQTLVRESMGKVEVGKDECSHSYRHLELGRNMKKQDNITARKRIEQG